MWVWGNNIAIQTAANLSVCQSLHVSTDVSIFYILRIDVYTQYIYTDIYVNQYVRIYRRRRMSYVVKWEKKEASTRKFLCPKATKEMVREERKFRGMLKILRPKYATLFKEVVRTENCLWTTGERIFSLGKNAYSTTLVPNTKHHINISTSTDQREVTFANKHCLYSLQWRSPSKYCRQSPSTLQYDNLHIQDI